MRACGPACWSPCRRCWAVLQRPGRWQPDLVMVAGLSLFALPFAVNSSLHDYLILAYAGSEKAVEDVGFYCAANAAGQLIGNLLSGALYQVGANGLPAPLRSDADRLLGHHLAAAGTHAMCSLTGLTDSPRFDYSRTMELSKVALHVAL